MGTSYVWVTGLICDHGHDLSPQSKARNDYEGYPKESVPLDVAEDLRDHPFYCMRCTSKVSTEQWRAAIQVVESTQDTSPPIRATDVCAMAAQYLGFPLYRLRLVGEPRSVCEGCGREAACGCYKVVAVEIEKVKEESK